VLMMAELKSNRINSWKDLLVRVGILFMVKIFDVHKLQQREGEGY
jgi:hypothetical protein